MEIECLEVQLTAARTGARRLQENLQDDLPKKKKSVKLIFQEEHHTNCPLNTTKANEIFLKKNHESIEGT
jgi:hypothetical protein